MTTHALPPTRPAAPEPTEAQFHERLRILQLIEDAERDSPYCICGASMTIRVDGDTLLLECPSFAEGTTGRLAWLRSGIRTVLHHRRIIERELGLAA